MPPEPRLVRIAGSENWFVAYYDGGKRVRRSLGTADRHLAQRALEQFKRQREAASRTAPIGLEEIWNRYADSLGGRVTARNLRWHWPRIKAHFGDTPPELIREEHVEAYIAARRAEGRREASIYTELGYLRTALNWAAKKSLIDRAPYIKRPPRPRARERYLTREEARRLLDAATLPHTRLFIILALATAGRAGAILDLTWDRIDFERGVIHLDDPAVYRTNKGRANVPMNSTARAALQEARRGATTPYVIEWAGDRVHKVYGSVTVAAKRAGLKGVSPHVLRHTAGVWMAEAGVPMSEIAQYMGHTNTAITERHYARYSPEYLRQAAGALELGPYEVLGGRIRTARGPKAGI